MNTNVHTSSDESERLCRSCGIQLKPPHIFFDAALSCDVMWSSELTLLLTAAGGCHTRSVIHVCSQTQHANARWANGPSLYLICRYFLQSSDLKKKDIKMAAFHFSFFSCTPPADQSFMTTRLLSIGEILLFNSNKKILPIWSHAN